VTYGGGFTRGDKILTNIAQSLIYYNAGTFFVLRYFTTIIPDYRRVGDPKTGIGEGVIYLSSGEDAATVLEWLHSASCPLQSLNRQRNVFTIGNSAGGVHLATYLLDARLESRRRCLFDVSSVYMLRGAVLVSVPFHFSNARSERQETLDWYWPVRPVWRVVKSFKGAFLS
jgi:predicted alpha/beta-fold hydrolase